MHTIVERLLPIQTAAIFKADEVEAENLFISMVTCCSMKFYPPTITPEMFDRIVNIVGERFLFLSKESEEIGRTPIEVAICRMYYQGDTAENATRHRIYMIPVNDILFHRQIVPAGKV